MDSGVLARKLEVLASRIDRRCRPFLNDGSRSLHDGFGSQKSQLERDLTAWRSELLALERQLAGKSGELAGQQIWRTQQSFSDKEKELQRSQQKLRSALLTLTVALDHVTDPPSIDAARKIAELAKSLDVSTKKDYVKVIQQPNIPPDLRIKLVQNQADGYTAVAVGAALLWEILKRFRKRGA